MNNYIRIACCGIMALLCRQLISCQEPSLLRVLPHAECVVVHPGTCTLFNDVEKAHQVERLLITRPYELLATNEPKLDQLRTLLQSEPEVGQKLLAYSRENPLGSIRECTSSWCPLNRQQFPHRRAWIEQYIVSDIQQRFPDKQKDLSVSFFAPGDLMSELIVATRLLKLGYNNLWINLIGFEREEYIECLRSGKDLPLEVHDDSRDKKVWLNFHNYRLAQFVQWLNRFSNRVTVAVYSGADNFQRDCAHRPQLMSDVSIGIDIFEGDDVVKLTCPYAYQLMNLKTLKEGGVAYTCSRHPLFSGSNGRSLCARALDMLYSKVATSAALKALASPPLEVVEKKYQPAQQEIEEIDTCCDAEWKKGGGVWGVLYALEALKQKSQQSMKATYFHQPDLKIIAGMIVAGGFIISSAVAGVGYLIFR